MFDCQPYVRLVQGNKAVSDHEGGAPTHQSGHRLHDHGLRLRVHGAGGLIEDEDRGVLEEGPGQRDALALAPESSKAVAGLV